jgi:hypothetical protein
VSGTLKEFGENTGLQKNAATAKLMEHLSKVPTTQKEPRLLIWKIIYHCFSRLALMDLSTNNGTQK